MSHLQGIPCRRGETEKGKTLRGQTEGRGRGEEEERHKKTVSLEIFLVTLCTETAKQVMRPDVDSCLVNYYFGSVSTSSNKSIYVREFYR